MRGASLAPHTSVSPEIAFMYNVKLKISCVCKNENLLEHRGKGKKERRYGTAPPGDTFQGNCYLVDSRTTLSFSLLLPKYLRPIKWRE